MRGTVSSMGKLVRMPPRGRYLAHEAGRIAGVSGSTIGQWARRGYIRSSQSGPGVLPRVYSYQDIAEAMVVHELVDRGVPPKEIHTSIEHLREHRGDWPLTEARGPLATADLAAGNSRPLLVMDDDDGLYDVGRSPSQRILEAGNLRQIAVDLSRGGWAARELPDLRRIEINPDVIGGRPSIRGRRIPAQLVAELAATPAGRQVLAIDYDDLDPEDIRDAERWWAAAKGFELAA